MVINYKQINDAMEGDAYFLPRKDLIIERVRNMNWFTTFDCKSGFYQIRLTEESKALTTFSCPQGQYEWNVLPMGMKQSPVFFNEESLQHLGYNATPLLKESNKLLCNRHFLSHKRFTFLSPLSLSLSLLSKHFTESLLTITSA